MNAFLLALHFLVCFVLIAVVLLQRGKGSDIGAALGGGGANTVFGSRGAGNFLTRLTTGSAIIFMLTSLTLAYFGGQDASVRLFQDSDLEEEAPTAPDTGLEPIEAPTGKTDAGTPDEPDDVGALEEIPEPPSE